MTDWHYHDPTQGRVGPLSAEQMRARYVDRRIQRDTLAWHAGAREWQPLERFADVLDLHTLTPDASQPPPLPPAAPMAAVAAHRAHPGAARVAQRTPARQAPQRRGMSGWVVLAIAAAVAVPVLGILAAIAIPAYQDYTVRARTAGLIGAASAMQRAVADFSTANGRCPGNDDFAPVLRQFAALGQQASVRFGALANGHCAFEFTLHGTSAIEGRTWLHEAHRRGELLEWDCSGGDLPARYRPAACRAP